jgi:hypothetical protein
MRVCLVLVLGEAARHDLAHLDEAAAVPAMKKMEACMSEVCMVVVETARVKVAMMECKAVVWEEVERMKQARERVYLAEAVMAGLATEAAKREEEVTRAEEAARVEEATRVEEVAMADQALPGWEVRPAVEMGTALWAEVVGRELVV